MRRLWGLGKGRSEVLRVALVGVPLGLWLATLQSLSATFTPFQRMGGLSTFVGEYVLLMHASVLVASLVAILLVQRGHSVDPRRLAIVSCALYVAGNAVVAVLAYTGLYIGGVPANALVTKVAVGGISVGPDLFALVPLALVSCLGDLGTGLAWGRVCAGGTPRASLGSVAIAGLVQAAASLMLTSVSPFACLVAYIACSAVSAAMVCLLTFAQVGEQAVQEVAPRDSLGEVVPVHLSWRGESGRERALAFMGVAGPALVGLFTSAFIQGSLRQMIVGHYQVQIVTLIVASLLLGWFALSPSRRPFSRVAYRSLIPVLAVTMLAVMNIAGVLGYGRLPSLAMLYLLYTFAALLTLVTLSSMANAGEFEPDLIFSLAMGLFSAFSLAGLAAGTAMSDEAVMVVAVVITTLYAFAMVVPYIMRDLPGDSGHLLAHEHIARDEVEGDDSVLGGQTASPTSGAVASEVGDAAPLSVWEGMIDERCAALAERCHLTNREAEILALLARGHGSAYISEVLYISPNTVRTHVHNLYGKIGINTREEIVQLFRA